MSLISKSASVLANHGDLTRFDKASNFEFWHRF